jgi:hypothetical protein
LTAPKKRKKYVRYDSQEQAKKARYAKSTALAKERVEGQRKAATSLTVALPAMSKLSRETMTEAETASKGGPADVASLFAKIKQMNKFIEGLTEDTKALQKMAPLVCPHRSLSYRNFEEASEIHRTTGPSASAASQQKSKASSLGIVKTVVKVSSRRHKPK